MRFALLPRALAAFFVTFAVSAAALPLALQGGGYWEVGTKANGQGGVRHCLSDSAILTQWEHRHAQCTRVVLGATADRVEVRYTCPSGGFGTSRVEQLTPRTVRVETQGISGGLPFGYTIHARRLGACPFVKR